MIFTYTHQKNYPPLCYPSSSTEKKEAREVGRRDAVLNPISRAKLGVYLQQPILNTAVVKNEKKQSHLAGTG